MASAVDATLPPTSKGSLANEPSAQRIKKREVDRRCQRLARERTKTRLAQLEALVEDFRRKDEDGQVARLMQQVEDLTSDKDKLIKTLRSIRNALKTGSESDEDDVIEIDTKSTTTSRRLSQQHSILDRPANIRTTSLEIPPTPGFPRSPHVATPGSTTRSEHGVHGSIEPPQSATTQSVAPELRSLHAAFWPSGSQSEPAPVSTQELIPYKPDFQFRDPCHKCSAHNNFWRFANETLIRHPTLTPEEMTFEAESNEEVPIVAMLHGWDQVKAMGKFTACWKELARIDKVIFPNTPIVERIAILRSMHLLMMYHIHPTSERFSALPSWYLLRPSQTMAHSYAVDYLAWPGVRERFIFFQHRYCENQFWDLLQQEMRIRWPYELRDVYTKNLETGQYKFSQTFNERLSDINAWTMGPDFFKRYPELISDIPRWNVIPKSIDSTALTAVGWQQERVGGAKRRMSNLEERRRQQSQQIGRIIQAGEEEQKRRSASVQSIDPLQTLPAARPTIMPEAAAAAAASFPSPSQWVAMDTTDASPAASTQPDQQTFDAYAHAHSTFVAEFDTLMYSAGVSNGGPTFLDAPPSMSPWGMAMDPSQIQWTHEDSFPRGTVEEIEAT